MDVLVTGAGGMLARALRAALAARGHGVVALERARLDVTDRSAVARALDSAGPDAVVQCAAYTRVDDAEREEARAFAVNAEGAANVAAACGRAGIRFVYPSTDYVFDGEATAPYPPEAPIAPINAYGRSKAAGEAAAREAPDHLIVRTSWLYGAGGRHFVAAILERARTGGPLRVVDDQRGSPTWTRDLADALVRLLEKRVPAGVYHVTNAGETTWYGFAREILRRSGLERSVEPVRTEDVPRPARRPRYSVLDCSASEEWIGPLRDWRDALAAALREGVAP